MYQVMKKIPTVIGRLKYISGILQVTVESLDEHISLSETQEVTEPFVEMLVGCLDDLEEQCNTNIGNKIIQKLENGNKIPAIKLFKEEFGASLKESKEEIESIYDGNKITVDKWVYDGKVLWRKK